MPAARARRMGRRSRRSRPWWAAAVAAALWIGAAPGAAGEPAAAPVEVGVLPTLSARRILETYRPLREHLERTLARPVLLVTAPDYRTFVARTRAGAYRYAVTAPHFARLAERESGYRALVRVRSALSALLVVRTSNAAREVAALRARTVATPDALAVISMLGRALLREHGLVPGEGVQVRAYPAFSSALLAVTGGDAAAAVTAQTALNQMPEAMRGALRVLARSAEIPHVMLIAQGSVPETERARVTAALLAFGENGDGARFFARTGFGGYVRVGEAELRRLDPFVDDLQAALAPR